MRRCVYVCGRRKLEYPPHPFPPQLQSHTNTHLLSTIDYHPPNPSQHCAPAAIDGVSELRGDVLINLDTLGIDLTSCCNDLLVFVKDHCLSGTRVMRRACLIVMETIITGELGQGSVFGSPPFPSLAHKHTPLGAHKRTTPQISILICLRCSGITSCLYTAPGLTTVLNRSG